MPIQLLPINLANQIAAGEVIERPASVVKELVENCLDAGASQITLDIEQGGRRRIRIRDNGSGVGKDELALALSRHATSKISTLNDLEAIETLGFRGEALASISSVSRLTFTSKPAAQAAAWQVWLEGRDMQAELAPASHPDGTTVDVQDLFFNTPARRKFLRTDKTEFTHIDELLRRIALARFGVRFTLNHNNKMVRNYAAVSAENQAIERVGQVCGQAFTDNAIPIDRVSGTVRLWGWVAPPSHCRHQGDVQYFYVNGRMMRDRLLSHAVRQAYGAQLGDDRVPTYVLYFELPPQDVDVNVHPAKHEVRFHQARQIHDFVLQTIRDQLASSHATESPVPATQHQHQYQQASAELARQVKELQPLRPEIFPTRAAVPETAVASHQPSVQQPSKALLGVVESRFALLNQGDIASVAISLLDLQRTQLAYLAQQLQHQWQTGLAGQPLLTPLQLTDKKLCQQLRQATSEQLARFGVRCDIAAQHITVLEVPSMLRHTDISRTLATLLSKLNDEDVFEWLAHFQIQDSYTVAQAEHWIEMWRDVLKADSNYLHAVPWPQLPEAINP